jgi:16S rRNA (guanine527-N7)-methyltransferase
MSPEEGPAGSPVLLGLLGRAQELGFLGPGPLEDHIGHSRAFLAALEMAEVPPGGTVLDLGAGGGVPGLVLLTARPELEVVLLDSLARRTAFLRDAVVALGADGRSTVVHARAEVAGRGAWRDGVDAVVARGFGPPGTTAECASPFLRLGGVLVVSDPPHGPDRWPADGLRALGLEPAGAMADPVHLRWFRRTGPCPDRFPRRDGIPRKRPLF